MAERHYPSVLVVEDENLIRLMLSDYLAACGFKVLEAASADDAVHMLEAAEDSIDVVFSDVHMPGGMDGFGLARWIRAHRPQTPVLLASGVAKRDDAAKQGIAAELFLQKPYDLKQLVEQISDLIATRH